MAQGDQRLDPVLMTFIENRIIEGKTFFIRLFIITVGENASPVDGQTIAFESHFAKEGYIFFVTVIHIDRFMRGIKNTRLNGRTECAGRIDITAQEQIRNRQALSAFQITAFTLIGSSSAAPKETISEY